MMASVGVKSSSGIYSVNVGTSFLKSRLSALKYENNYDTCYVFIDENVWNYHKKWINESFRSAKLISDFRLIPAGEKSKSIEQWNELIDYLLKSGVRRNTPLFAIGGGVTGDLAGFVAASVLRGIPLIHIPTTLLAMVDSSIGGKTGINHATGKNLIGAFYQPVEVVADLHFLSTLPRREWMNGLSEILKYGAIRDAGIFEQASIFLETDQLHQQTDQLEKLIVSCANIKADVVMADEFEAESRAYLNFGHTFAHALEKVADFSLLNHGEAVYLGMLAAITLSNQNGASLSKDPVYRFRDLYTFQVARSQLPVNKLLAAMKSDKKVIDDAYRFVLLKDWQQPVVESVNDEELIKEACLTIFNELS